MGFFMVGYLGFMSRPPSKLSIPDGKELTFELALALIIRERRKELAMSQEDLADDTLTQSHISFLESGKREIGMSRFILLARKLQMEPWELLREVVERMLHH